jgi:hypothetical protein
MGRSGAGEGRRLLYDSRVSMGLRAWLMALFCIVCGACARAGQTLGQRLMQCVSRPSSRLRSAWSQTLVMGQRAALRMALWCRRLHDHRAFESSIAVAVVLNTSTSTCWLSFRKCVRSCCDILDARVWLSRYFDVVQLLRP